VSYLAFSLPVIAAGIAVTHYGLRSTAIVYGGVVAALALAAAASSALSRRGGHAAVTASPVDSAEQAARPPGARTAPICLAEAGQQDGVSAGPSGGDTKARC
jgi:hypothetical protein